MGNNPITKMLDDALRMGLTLKSDDVTETSVVRMVVPTDFPKKMLEQLTSDTNKPQVRLLWRVRELSKWLSEDYKQWWDGKSPLEGDEYANLINAFVDGDKLLRFTYDFEVCIWGEKGCNAATGYAPVLCDGCTS